MGSTQKLDMVRGRTAPEGGLAERSSCRHRARPHHSNIAAFPQAAQPVAGARAVPRPTLPRGSAGGSAENGRADATPTRQAGPTPAAAAGRGLPCTCGAHAPGTRTSGRRRTGRRVGSRTAGAGGRGWGRAAGPRPASSSAAPGPGTALCALGTPASRPTECEVQTSVQGVRLTRGHPPMRHSSAGPHTVQGTDESERL